MRGQGKWGPHVRVAQSTGCKRDRHKAMANKHPQQQLGVGYDLHHNISKQH